MLIKCDMLALIGIEHVKFTRTRGTRSSPKIFDANNSVRADAPLDELSNYSIPVFVLGISLYSSE